MENEEQWDFDIFELEAATHKRSVNARVHKLKLLKSGLNVIRSLSSLPALLKLN